MADETALGQEQEDQGSVRKSNQSKTTKVKTSGVSYALGSGALGPKEILESIKTGLPFSVVTDLQGRYGLTLQQIAPILSVSTRTLERRRSSGTLDAQTSDRVYRLVRVFEQVSELFEGDEESARQWIKTRNPALEGLAPEEMLKSEAGVVIVENLIGRLENGVFS